MKRRQDPHGQPRGAALVNQLQQRVQVVAAITGELLGQSLAESGIAQQRDAPAEDLPTNCRLGLHTMFVFWRRRFLPVRKGVVLRQSAASRVPGKEGRSHPNDPAGHCRLFTESSFPVIGGVLDAGVGVAESGWECRLLLWPVTTGGDGRLRVRTKPFCLPPLGTESPSF